MKGGTFKFRVDNGGGNLCFTAKLKKIVQHLRKYSSLFLDRFFNKNISQTQQPYGKIPLSRSPEHR